MAWGLWNKIKQGVRKAGNFAKSAARVITDKVIKPFKPVITAAATAFNPTAGMIAHKAMDTIERWSDGGEMDVDDMAKKASSAVTWAKSKWG